MFHEDKRPQASPIVVHMSQLSSKIDIGADMEVVDQRTRFLLMIAPLNQRREILQEVKRPPMNIPRNTQALAFRSTISLRGRLERSLSAVA